MDFEELKLYLPKFLSGDSTKELFSCLKDFPRNLDGRFYTNHLESEKVVFQGDGIRNMIITNLPSEGRKKANGIIISNTCDISPTNKRNFNSRIIYAPVIPFQKYIKSVKTSSKKTEEQLMNQFDNIRKQLVTQIFYLPKKNGVIDESIVFLDRVYNISLNYIDIDDLNSSRLFSLSNYGAYLFVLKLSIHFTRLQDGVDRG